LVFHGPMSQPVIQRRLCAAKRRHIV
jgi:hypothetical protein